MEKSFICEAGNGTHVLSTSNRYRIIACGDQTENRYSLMEAILEPGQGAPLHIHTREDEAFFVLEGSITFYLKDKKIHAQKEDFVSCAPNEIRGFKNNTDQVARMLLFYSTAGIEEMTVRSGTIIDAHHLPSEGHYKVQCPVLSEEYGVKEIDMAVPD